MIRKISPASIYALTLFVYMAPVIYLFLNDDGFMVKFVSGHNLKNGVTVFAIVFLFAVVLYFIAGVGNVWNLKIPRYNNERIWWIVFFMFSLIAIVSAAILFNALDMAVLINYAINDQIQFLIMQPTIGVALSESGLLKFFMLSYFLSYLWMLVFMKLGTNSYTKKTLFILSFLVIGLFYFLLTRRELLMYHIANFVIGFVSSNNLKKILIIAVGCIALMFYIVILRMGDADYDGGLINSYFRSEEFYPFQFSAYLIDKWVENPYIKNFYEISPFVLFTDQRATLSPGLMAEFFNYYGPGPTVGIFYSVLAYGIFYPILYFYFLTRVLWYFYKKCLNKINGWIYYPFYTFIALKFFLLIRNGEFVNNFIDLFVFSMLCVPFMILGVRRYGE